MYYFILKTAPPIFNHHDGEWRNGTPTPRPQSKRSHFSQSKQGPEKRTNGKNASRRCVWTRERLLRWLKIIGQQFVSTSSKSPPRLFFLVILQELQALIKYIGINKAGDLDWFTIKPTNKDGTHWAGKCWYVHELIKYEFDFQASS